MYRLCVNGMDIYVIADLYCTCNLSISTYKDLISACFTFGVVDYTISCTIRPINLFFRLIDSLYIFQGKTVEVGRAHFETESTRFTILDAPVAFLSLTCTFRSCYLFFILVLIFCIYTFAKLCKKLVFDWILYVFAIIPLLGHIYGWTVVASKLLEVACTQINKTFRHLCKYQLCRGVCLVSLICKGSICEKPF